MTESLKDPNISNKKSNSSSRYNKERINDDPNSNVIVKLQGVSLKNNAEVILDDISFEINSGDFLGLIGPNGAGKTTLFRCILGLNKDYSGTIKIFDKDIRSNVKDIYNKIGYIPQTSNFDSKFPATVKEIINLGSRSNKKKIDREKINEMVELTGISEILNKRIGELSGGQRQRVMIAKALMHDPQLLILDEPDTAIDATVLKLFYKILIKLNKEKDITIIWSSHDLDAVNLLSNKVACIHKKLFFHGISDEFFSNETNLKAFSESSMQIHIKSHHHHP